MCLMVVYNMGIVNIVNKGSTRLIVTLSESIDVISRRNVQMCSWGRIGIGTSSQGEMAPSSGFFF